MKSRNDASPHGSKTDLKGSSAKLNGSTTTLTSGDSPTKRIGGPSRQMSVVPKEEEAEKEKKAEKQYEAERIETGQVEMVDGPTL